MSSLEYRGKVHKQFKDYVSENVVAIGVDKKGYLVKYAKDAKGFMKLLRDKKVSYVILDNTPEGSFAVDLDGQSVSSGVEFLPDRVLPDFAMEQLLKVSNKDKNVMMDELVYGNKLTLHLSNLYKEDGYSVDVRALSTGDTTGMLPMFRTCIVFHGNFTLFITGQQMSCITSAGIVKIHDTGKDIELEDLISVMLDFLPTNTKELSDILTAQ